MNKQAKIFVAGHRGLVGSALVRILDLNGYSNIICRTRDELDLTNTASVSEFFESERPEYIFLAAAKVGGILANSSFQADFIYDNLRIQNNIIDAAYKYKAKKLLFLGSSCIYPKNCPQPIKEDYLLSGKLEPTNEPYAIAKIAGISMCKAYRAQYGCNFISVMPTNLYGPNDNYNLETSHVLSALIRKFHEAKQNGENAVVLWGTGTPKREFLYADDLAEACVFLMQNYDESEIVNVGCGEDISINNLALLIKEAVGYKGEIMHDFTKPDGTPQKLLDISKIKRLGWEPKITLRQGISSAYNCFLNLNYAL